MREGESVGIASKSVLLPVRLAEAVDRLDDVFGDDRNEKVAYIVRSWLVDNKDLRGLFPKKDDREVA